MTQKNNNKKSFWQKYKYVLLFTLIIPVALVIIRALRTPKSQDKHPASQNNFKKNEANQAQSIDKNTTPDTLNNEKQAAAKDTTAQQEEKADSSVSKQATQTKQPLAINAPYTKYYTPKKAPSKQRAIPELVHFYYPPNQKNTQPKKSPRKLTAPSPIKETPKPSYQIEVLPEPQAEILSDKVAIFANVELKNILLNRKVTQDADGLIKKVYKTKQGEVGEVEMELWILARHWQRSNGRMQNKVYCTNEKGTLSIDNLQDGRLYVEPVLNEKNVLFGTLQQMPQDNPIEIVETQKKKFKSFDDQYNQYTWFKVKVKGYIKWHKPSGRKDKGK